jgi:hypothetical protein
MVPFPFPERTVVKGSETRSFAPNALQEDQHVSVDGDVGAGERSGRMFGKKAHWVSYFYKRTQFDVVRNGLVPNKKPRLICGIGAGGSIRLFRSAHISLCSLLRLFQEPESMAVCQTIL